MSTTTPRTTPQCRAAVRRGIALLNKNFPSWRELLKVRKREHDYDFENPCRCVLGSIGATCLRANRGSVTLHVPTNFDAGKDVVGIVEMPHYYGFDWSAKGGDVEAKRLAKLWNQAIRTGRV